MRRIFTLFLFLLFSVGVKSQSPDSASNKLTVKGFADIYFGYHFNKPQANTAPYGVFAMQHNEFALNLAYIRVSGQSGKFRFSLAPGVGTYMSANYAAEPAALRNIYEAYAGVQLSAKKEIWLEAGVLPSPYTNETAENTDHLTYSRSLGSEYSPYYLSGMRLILPVTEKWVFTAWGITGWQTIVNQGDKPALGLSLSGTDVKGWNLGYSSFIGNVQTPSLLHYGMRYFLESNAGKIFGKNEVRICASSGLQQFTDTTLKNATWIAANIQYRRNINDRHSLSARIDTYRDAKAVVIQNITGGTLFNNVNFTANYTFKLRPEMFFRLEGRHYVSAKNTFFDSNGTPAGQSTQVIAAFTMKL